MKLVKSFIGIGLLVIGVGCVTTSDWYQIATDEQKKILKLASGMTKQEVISIMGTETIFGNYVSIGRPFRNSMYNKNGDVIEIFYYFTEIDNSNGVIDDGELTPLVFINGKLDSWGWESWVEKAKRYDINVNYKLN